MDADRSLDREQSDFLRRCAICERSKPSSEFHRSRTGQFSYCRECRCAYDRRYYAERGKPARQERTRVRREAAHVWMDALKAGRTCADCGEMFPPYVMHWDHLPGHIKVAEVGTMVSGGWNRDAIRNEMKKCELVCANCHVMRTVRRARRTIAEDEWGYRIVRISAA